MTVGAVARQQASSERILRHFGQERSFQRYVATKDLDLGSQTWAVAGDPIVAASDWENRKTYKQDADGFRKVTSIERVLLVAKRPFVAAGTDLTSDWRVTIDGIERRIGSAVLDEDGEGDYVVRFSDHGR